MPLIPIPKKTKGEFRQIYAPSKKEKARLRLLLPELNQIALDNCGMSTVHGFMPGKSPVTNARAHIGFQYSLSFDLKDFFDTVKPEMVKQYLGNKTGEYFINSRAYQGLPTSPQIANLAAIKMDREILDYCCLNDIPNHPKVELIKYTRYADDLTFSFNEYKEYQGLIENVPIMVKNHGFIINQKKTRLQSAKFGRRIITGISVGDTNIGVPRRVKKLVKVMEFQRKQKLLANNPKAIQTPEDLKRYPGTHLHGLKEWCKLKLPHFPISHTLKVIHEIIIYMKMVNLVKQQEYFKISPLLLTLNSLKSRAGRKTYCKLALQEIQRKNSEITDEKIRFIDSIVTERERVCCEEKLNKVVASAV